MMSPKRLAELESGLEFREITRTIIGCAYRLYNTLGFGFLESVYEKAMLVELRKAGLAAEAQKRITVLYDGEAVGDFLADLLVSETVVVELKSVRSLTTAHEVQLVNYLTATGKPVGLLLNFGESGVEVRRTVRVLKGQAHLGSEAATAPEGPEIHSSC